MGRWFRRYWPWLVAFLWLIGYELWAVATHHPTLSQMVWSATAAWPLLPFVVIPCVILLSLHFWAGLWR